MVRAEDSESGLRVSVPSSATNLPVNLGQLLASSLNFPTGKMEIRMSNTNECSEASFIGSKMP